jgi:hypothetical protein
MILLTIVTGIVDATGIQLVLLAGAIIVAAAAGDHIGSTSRWRVDHPARTRNGSSERDGPQARRSRSHDDRLDAHADWHRRRLAARRRFRSEHGSAPARRGGDAARATVGALLVPKVAPTAALVLAAGMLALVCLAAHHAHSHSDPPDRG